ncbi:MAG: DUF6525 family protein [Pseudomonadota bacterium]
MPTNRGKTSLKRRRRNASPMYEFDRLPVELRAWLTSAVLPWSPRSVRRVYDRAMVRTRNVDKALGELRQIEQRAIARDSRRVWGPDHPFAIEDAVQ